ncbi:MAG: flavin reductase family protein [Eggerthellaceae bacterium]|jgi:flavin reductase (DIM6/NTAB) family NADH-FMN oxidoreductase RutF
MKREIDVYAYGTQILEAVNKGVLLNSQAEGKLNTMTISWGSLGTCWSAPTFVTYVRTGRFTHELLEKNPYFTVSIPLEGFDRTILGKAGSTTGRNCDKIAELGLTPFQAQVNGVPGFKEAPLTLECKVVYKQTFDSAALTDGNRAQFYPADQDSSCCGANRDMHTAYYGQVVAAYIEE